MSDASVWAFAAPVATTFAAPRRVAAARSVAASRRWLHPSRRITRHWSGPRRRCSLLAVERRACAAAAAQRLYVMRRKLFNMLTALSLALCAGMLGMWVRGFLPTHLRFEAKQGRLVVYANEMSDAAFEHAM